MKKIMIMMKKCMSSNNIVILKMRKKNKHTRMIQVCKKSKDMKILLSYLKSHKPRFHFYHWEWEDSNKNKIFLLWDLTN